jgi:hypothetical protein
VSRIIVRVIEVLSILVIVGSIAALAVPKAADVRRAEAAERIVGDVEVLRAAVYSFYSDSAYFPAELPDGLIPDGLVPYLPGSFSSRRAYGTIEYKNWPLSPVVDTAGAPAPNVVGAVVTPVDARVGAGAAARARGTPRFTVGNKYTFVFFGS